jgi:hypothetical protein
MMKKSILLALILIISYELFVRATAFNWDTSQNDKSANIISAQNFIYNLSDKEVTADTIIIGSSIGRKLTTELLGKNYYNLAFNAWGAYDGMEIVRLTKKKPACLLVETNVVSNQTLQEDIVGSLKPLTYYSNVFMKSFQLKNQPVGLVVGGIKQKLKAKMEEMKMKKRENQTLYDLNIKLEKEKLDITLPDSVYTSRFIKLKELIGGFKAQGIPIVFFEVPYDTTLINTATNLKNRQYFQKYFPSSQYTYIPLPPVNDYIYSDGIHLSVKSAPVFTQYLKTSLANLNSN